VNVSLVAMMIHTGLMVKTVMLILLFFSVVSWSIIIMKQLMFRRVRQNSEEFLDRFWASKTLNEAYDSAKEYTLSPEAAVFVSGFHELKKLGAAREHQDPERETLDMQLATLDNLKRSLRKAHIFEIDRLGHSLPFLATTGSAAPFIGLFGTVWGIMSSFQDIGMRGSASLAVVAPGISEALVATAAGLAVAIPRLSPIIFLPINCQNSIRILSTFQRISSILLNVIS